MATTAQRLSVLDIVNDVRELLHLDPVVALGDDRTADIILQKLNYTITNISDKGDLVELYREVQVSVASSTQTVVIDTTTEDVHHIDAIYWGNQAPELLPISKRDLKRLKVAGSQWGTPTRYAVVGVSGLAPKIELWQAPTSAAAVDAGIYVKPPRYTNSDGAVVPPFEAGLLIQGTYAFMLLHESGGTETPEFIVEYKIYENLRNEAANRFNSDMSGHTIQFVVG